MTGTESGRESFIQAGSGYRLLLAVQSRPAAPALHSRPVHSLVFGWAWRQLLGTMGSVQPDIQGRVDLARQRREIERIRADLSSKARDERRGATRATARILDNFHREGRLGCLVVESEEPIARGGTEQGPSPLQY